MFTKTANWLLLGLTLIVAAVLALFMLIKSQDRIADLELAPTAIVDRQGNYHRITWLDEQTLLIEVAEPQFIPVVNTRIWTLDTESLEMRRVDLPDYPGCSDTAFSIPMALGDGRLGYIAICRKWPELRMPHYMMAYDLQSRTSEQLIDYRLDPVARWMGDEAWNPEHTRAVGTIGDLYQDEQLVLLTGTEPTRVETGFPLNYGPSWSPKGDIIAFWGADEEGQPHVITPVHLYGINPDSKEIRQLIPNLVYDPTDPTWSPDGQLLVFSGRVQRDMLTSQEGIWLVDVSTGAISKISSGRYSSLSISPDGRKLAVIGYANTSPPFSYEIVLFDIESALDKSSLQN